MSKYSDRAIELHDKGYNCAQAVLCAFSEKTDLDEKTLYKLSEGLGAGMGNRKNTCGALTGAVVLAGLVSSSGDVEASTKSATYKLAGDIVDYFEQMCNGLTCEEIKGLKTGLPTVTCDECIKRAVEAAEEILVKNN